MGDPVIIVPYNPEWPVWFQQLRAYLEPALAGIDTIIEHVGSTSVSGLMAKPIIDTDIIIDRPLFPEVRERLALIGYTHRGDLGCKDREAFAADHLPPGVSLPPHHLYGCIAGTPHVTKHLLFRDYLRCHEADMLAYGLLKAQLADRFGTDRDGYTEAKTEFIMDVMQKAQLWDRQGRPVAL